MKVPGKTDPVTEPPYAAANTPERPWTVASLAAECGLSRAALARRFGEVVGEPPLTYLTARRLALAADLLLEPGSTLASVADRVGYGNAFNSISLQVSNGVVTLAGHARTDVDKDSAMALVSTYPGVKDVSDEIQVDPVSIMDNQLRLQVARAVYGFPSLNKYAIDPAKSIRISVQNGNVELYGVVDTQSDKDVAYLRANQVPGVFSVKNYLQVANQAPEKSKQSAMNQ